MIIEPGNMLIFVAGHAPIYGTQSLYFRDPVFSARVKLPVPAGSPGIAASRRRHKSAVQAMSPRRFAFAVWGLAAAVAAAVHAGRCRRAAHQSHRFAAHGAVAHRRPGSAIARGDIVSICPPDTAVFRAARARGYVPYGRCPGGYEPLLKPVAAIAGDIVIGHAGWLAGERPRLVQQRGAGCRQRRPAFASTPCRLLHRRRGGTLARLKFQRRLVR